MKTILHTIDTTGPGGAETVFINLATCLPSDKYRAVVVIRGRGWVYEELCRRGVEPILMDAKGSLHWRYLGNLINLIRRERVDLIQSHLLGANVYCSLAGWLTGVPVVATFHGSVDIGDKERFRAAKFAAINRGASRIIAVSAELLHDIGARTSLKKNKTQIIYNGIRCADFQRQRSRQLREQWGWSNHEFVIGSLGNIRRAKAYDVLLRAAALLMDQPVKFRFVIAGQPDKGDLYNNLLTLHKDLKLGDRVKFLGFIDDSADYLANLDLFLSSSTSEGLPLSAIQAMAAGLPLLATRCGGYQELVTHQHNGWLVTPGDPQALADAIVLLASDAALRETMAHNALQHVQATFDERVMLAAYQAVYEQC